MLQLFKHNLMGAEDETTLNTYLLNTYTAYAKKQSRWEQLKILEVLKDALKALFPWDWKFELIILLVKYKSRGSI